MDQSGISLWIEAAAMDVFGEHCSAEDSEYVL